MGIERLAIDAAKMEKVGEEIEYIPEETIADLKTTEAVAELNTMGY